MKGSRKISRSLGALVAALFGWVEQRGLERKLENRLRLQQDRNFANKVDEL